MRRAVLASVLGGALLLAGCGDGDEVTIQTTGPAAGSADPASLFTGAAEATTEGDQLVVTSNGIPDYDVGGFPGPSNPNSVEEQDFTFTIPLQPKRAAEPGELPMGPIGVMVNGIPFYNPNNAQGQDAVEVEVFDSCEGHPDPQGIYHYHQYSDCVTDDPGEGHSPLIGFAFDGYALYGLNDENGKPPTDLDRCNGHTDPERGYHYHATKGSPYLLGCYRGEVAEDADGGAGAPAGGPGPPMP